MSISMKDLLARKKLKIVEEKEGQEEFNAEEAQEETDEVEAENELASEQGQHLEAKEEDYSEIDEDNSLEDTKDSDHISDKAEKEEKNQGKLDAFKKRRLLARIRKLKE